MLLALAMVAAMIIASTVVMTNMRTQGQRQREREMVWRGKQYVTAIKRFYRRSGHYPQDLDELEKGVANIHFLRQAALRDPMNSDEDGKWRFIYTNASGQIIGSVHYATMQQMAILDLNGGRIPNTQPSGANADSGGNLGTSGSSVNGNAGTGDNANPATVSSSDQDSASNANCPPATNANQLASSQSQFGLGGLGSGASGPGVGSGVIGMTPNGGAFAGSSAVAQFGSSGTQDQTGPDSSTACPQGQGAQLAGAMGVQPAALQALLQMKPTGPVDSPVIGGFLIGVGSTVDRKSVRVYKGGKKYKDWEFIWNPLEEQALAMQQAMGQSGGLGGVMGSAMGGMQPNGIGAPGAAGPAGPGQTPPNDQQQPQP